MRFVVHLGDITALAVDAIVNAANTELVPGGGVCGAIHRAAGPELAEECALIGMCLTGHAVITHGFRLPAPWVVHAVGPVWQGGQRGEPTALHMTYFNSLNAARQKGCKRIAFPCISTGIYGYPPDLAAGVALAAMADFERFDPGAIEEVFLCCFAQADADRYSAMLALNHHETP